MSLWEIKTNVAGWSTVTPDKQSRPVDVATGAGRGWTGKGGQEKESGKGRE